MSIPWWATAATAILVAYLGWLGLKAVRLAQIQVRCVDREGWIKEIADQVRRQGEKLDRVAETTAKILGILNGKGD